VAGTGVGIAAVGAGIYAGYGGMMLEEAGGILFEHHTGLPLVINPIDIVQRGMKKGAKKFALGGNEFAYSPFLGIHGNSHSSTRPATLYKLKDPDGALLKWGISQDPSKRYRKGFMEDKSMEIISSGSRAEMVTIERRLVETDPGKLNREPWAGKQLGE